MSSAAYKYIKYAMFAGVRFTELEEIPLHSLYPPTPSSPISVHRIWWASLCLIELQRR